MKLKTLLLSSIISLPSFGPSLANSNVAVGLAFRNSDIPPMRSSEFVDRALASFKRYAGSDDVFDARDEGRLSPLAARQAAGFSKSDFERVKSLDLDGDSKVQKDEVQIWAMDAFDSYDVNGNAVIDGNELQELSKDFEPYRAIAAHASEPESIVVHLETPRTPTYMLGMAQQSTCDLPDTDGAKVAFVSKYEAGNLIDIAIAGKDTEADSTEIHIEPGSEPLYVIAQTFTPTVWRVTGDVSRVSRFVVPGINRGNGTSDGVGVAGLPEDKVTFLPGTNCLEWKGDEAGRYQQMVDLAQKLGKSPDKVVSNYTMSTVALPSGKFTEPDRGRPINLQAMFPNMTSAIARSDAAQNLSHYSPLGLLRIDPSSVVATTEVEIYDVLPQQAGLVQLQVEGKMVEQDRLYRIVQPIPRYPAGLGGAHSVKFMICDGVPQPGGSPGHSDVLNEVPMVADPVCEAHRG
ncbi:hypothetical protein OIU34_20475 [Pararhizobium sp. BT-229]|uniref:hypothetical protein n=1 Tax=Pararhizobium sp. BT-229 TaxID=2986923 RepID=UPI0021F6DD72|nr:hypothetical protein [Pararhizobium sp. BT-229]MCV9964265.1 hypothetical protein [Pararhizobium sp. BT-229]